MQLLWLLCSCTLVLLQERKSAKSATVPRLTRVQEWLMLLHSGALAALVALARAQEWQDSQGPKFCINTLFYPKSLKNHTLFRTHLSPRDPTPSSTSFQNPTLSSTEIRKKPYLCCPSIIISPLMGAPPPWEEIFHLPMMELLKFLNRPQLGDCPTQ